MTFEERLAELGVDLSDLPRKWMTCASEPYSGEQCYKAHGAAWAWYVGEDQRAVPELEQQETTRDRMILRQYILHLVDVIDRMETRLVNVTGERDYFLQFIQKYRNWIGSYPCDICKSYSKSDKCWRSCYEWINNQGTESFEFGVPEDWSVDG